MTAPSAAALRRSDDDPAAGLIGATSEPAWPEVAVIVLVAATAVGASALDLRLIDNRRFPDLDTAAVVMALPLAVTAAWAARRSPSRLRQTLRGPALRWFWAWSLWAMAAGLAGARGYQSLAVAAGYGSLCVLGGLLSRVRGGVGLVLATAGVAHLGLSTLAWLAGADIPLVAGRLDLFALEANQLARFLGLTAIGALWLIYEQRSWFRLWGALILPIAIVALVATESRTAAIAFGAALAVFAHRRHGGRALAVVVALGLLALGGLATLNKVDGMIYVVSRGGNLTELSTATGRTAVWPTFAADAGHHVITGRGVAAIDDAAPLIANAGQLSFVAEQAHNLALQVAVGTGLVGLALFSAGIVATWRRSTNPFAAATLSFILIVGLTEGVLLAPSFAWFALVAAAALADRASATDQIQDPRLSSRDSASSVVRPSNVHDTAG